MIIFIIPKNSGLGICRKIAKNLFSKNSKLIFARGEDVPLFAEKLILKEKNVIGLTGEDLFKEFLLNNPNTKVKVIKKISWKDKDALFRKPTLCLLGAKNRSLDNLQKELNVCINKKYSRIAEKFLSKLKNSKINKIYFSGSTEETFVSGVADLVIDIVYSGTSAEKVGLKIYKKIMSSDIVLIGKNKETLLNCKKLKAV